VRHDAPPPLISGANAISGITLLPPAVISRSARPRPAAGAVALGFALFNVVALPCHRRIWPCSDARESAEGELTIELGACATGPRPQGPGKIPQPPARPDVWRPGPGPAVSACWASRGCGLARMLAPGVGAASVPCGLRSPVTSMPETVACSTAAGVLLLSPAPCSCRRLNLLGSVSVAVRCSWGDTCIGSAGGGGKLKE